MSGRYLGDPCPLGPDQIPISTMPPMLPTTPTHIPIQWSSRIAVASNMGMQDRSFSGQDCREHKLEHEQAFALARLRPVAIPHQWPSSHSSLWVPKRSRSPKKEYAPPFQYRFQPRPEGYHLASPAASHPPAEFPFHEAQSSGQNARRLALNQPLPLAAPQPLSLESSDRARFVPPRPSRSPGFYDLDRIVDPRFRSTSAPFVLPFDQDPSVEPYQRSPCLNETREFTAKPLEFNAAKSCYTPELVPPHLPGGYNPLLNPFIPKLKASLPELTPKPNFWRRAFKNISGRSDVTHQPTRPLSPLSRLRSATSPFPRPRAPTPTCGKRISQPQAFYFGSINSGLHFKSLEYIPTLNKVAEKRSPCFTTEEGNAPSNRGRADPQELEAWRKTQNRSKKVFDSADLTSAEFAFGNFEDYLPPSHQYRPDRREDTTNLASQSVTPRGSRDSVSTLATQVEGLGIDQNSVRPFSWQLPESRTPRYSATTLVGTPQESRIYKDPEERYFSVTPTRQGHTQEIGAGKHAEDAEHWSDIPNSTLKESRSSPIPSIFFKDICEAVDSQTSLQAEADLTKSSPDTGLQHSDPWKHHHHALQPKSELPSSTPKSEGYSQAYWALTGGRPTNSICHYWDSQFSTPDVEDVTSDCEPVQSEELLNNHRSPSSISHIEAHSPSRGRGRGRLRNIPSVASKDTVRGNECSIVRRRYLIQQRKEARIAHQETVAKRLERQVAGEDCINKFLGAQREEDSTRFPTSWSPIRLKRNNSNFRREQSKRRRRLAATSSSHVETPAKKCYPDRDLQEAHSRESEWQRGCAENKEDDEEGDKVASLDCHLPSARTGIVKPTLRASLRYSDQIREEEILICLRSKTGSLKALPVTPEEKTKIRKVLQPEAGYTPSVYSGDSKSSLCVTPLAFKKSPATPSSGKSPLLFSPLTQLDPFHSTHSFLDSCFSVLEEPPLTDMETLQIPSALRSSTKTKAEEDAQAMQKVVFEACKKAGRDPPKYVLMELIGKGSFGRVYKGKDINTTQVVAVKIIDIDESDTLNPRLADTYSEFMKEVNALKILSDSKAKNINHVIEALPVGTAMWMITEYCGGGSIATLMKPTPDGLKEKFIIPILREVAEAVKWVHQAGIIHRDLKCANILITEDGGIQLCDFGVAGITETALDKRSTFIGTPHWMAPELFHGSQYGKEVDIWAFGSMTYEMATGLPPNAMSGLPAMDLGAYLKTHLPRLEGENHSEGLKSIVAFCLEENPSDRPTIEAVQRHNYIYNTIAKYPSSGLSDLVKAFKLWESHGGTRKSLFAAGGAQAPSELSSTALSDDNWNFSTTDAFDQAVAQGANRDAIVNVYGAQAANSTDFGDETSRPLRQQQARPSRRRPPPEALAPLKAPLEKLFDPNTMSNYKDNSIQHFNLQPNIASDLPLRDDSATSIRDTLIDLDVHDVPSGLSSFSDMDTMKPARRTAQDESEDDYESSSSRDFVRSALSDPADNPNRRTQDWTFPSMAAPASANPEFARHPPLQRPNITPASGARPALAHHPTEPAYLPTQSSYSLAPPATASDRMSLIDLDLSNPETSRPSTADSAASQDNNFSNPFAYERHASLNNSQNQRPAREPSMYYDNASSGQHSRSGSTLQDVVEISDFSASDTEGYPDEHYHSNHTGHEPYYEQSSAGHMQGDYEPNPTSNGSRWNGLNPSSASHSTARFHPLPTPPSAAVLSGTASLAEVRAETHRMISTWKDSLEDFRDVYERMPTRPPKNNQGASGDDSR